MGKTSKKEKRGRPAVVPTAWESLKKFFKDVYREIHPASGRVSWPSWESVQISTVMVIASTIILAVYIMLCDMVLRYLYRMVMG